MYQTNNLNLEKLSDGIFRICVPFDNIYTSVFILTTHHKTILLDSASYPEDADNYIVPALESLELTPDIILCSHFHGDHCGALNKLLCQYPLLQIGLFDKNKSFGNHTVNYYNDGDILFERYQLLNLKGHTDDCMAVLDLKTKILLSNDCLQQYGISHYGSSLTNSNDYFRSLERVKNLRIDKIIMSHDYIPMGYSILGKDCIDKCLQICREHIIKIKNFSCRHNELSDSNIAELFNTEHPTIPQITDITVSAIKSSPTRTQSNRGSL